MNDTQKNLNSEAFSKLYEIIVKLRSPQGCPWDREQTPHTLRAGLIEEVFECVKAIDENDSAHIKEELGDIFLLATMISYMHEQTGAFKVQDTLNAVTEKLVRRHPHVFGTRKVKDSYEVLENWARDKVVNEGRKPKDSLMDEVPLGIPPLQRAYKIQQKAAQTGFDWTNIEELFDKIQEELNELNRAIKNADTKNIEDEAGDLIFTAVNLCRFLNIDPSVALQGSNARFTERFNYVEKKMKEARQDMKKDPSSNALMEMYWEQAKASL